MSIDPFRQCDETHRGAATKLKKKRKEVTNKPTTQHCFRSSCFAAVSDDIQYMLGCLLQLCAMIHIDIYSASFNLQ